MRSVLVARDGLQTKVGIKICVVGHMTVVTHQASLQPVPLPNVSWERSTTDITVVIILKDYVQLIA